MAVKKKNAAGPSGRKGAGTLDKGLRVLECVDASRAPLSIQEIADRTGIQRLAVFRLLTTLEERRFVRRLDDKRYIGEAHWRFSMGYLAPMSGNDFRTTLAASIQAAAKARRVDLTMLDAPEFDEAVTLRMANELGPDVAVSFEPVATMCHTVADRFFGTGIPFITVEIPIEGGIHFGANNYEVDNMAGEELGRFAIEQWKGKYDRVVLIGSLLSPVSVQARMSRVVIGLRQVLGDIPSAKVINVYGKAHREDTFRTMLELLPSEPMKGRLLISAFNDVSALGALDAVRELRLERRVAIVGQNATRESRDEIRRPESRLIGSVAYFPERYGDRLIDLANAIANGEPTPPAVYTEHSVLTKGNIGSMYPKERD